MTEEKKLTPVEQAIAAAKAASEAAAAAAQSAQATSTSVATQTTTGSNVSVAVAPGPKMTMESVQGQGMSVDAWFKVEKDGLRIGDSPIKFAGIPVILNMTDGIGFVVKKGVKAGNPAQYAYTTDEATCTSGGTWEGALARMRAIDPKATPYRCVDLPFKVAEDFEATFLPAGAKEVKKEIVAKKDQIIGLTTATTNWAAWDKFYREVATAGLLGKNVLLTLGADYRTNKNGNEWGTMSFTLVGDYDAISAENQAPD